MTTPWTEIGKAFDDADRDANPVGTLRQCAAGSRMDGHIWLAGLPGLWKVRTAKLENGVWMHELQRVG